MKRVGLMDASIKPLLEFFIWFLGRQIVSTAYRKDPYVKIVSGANHVEQSPQDEGRCLAEAQIINCKI